MRIPIVFGCVIVGLVFSEGAARAADSCCIGAPFPPVVYAPAPVGFLFLPTAFVLKSPVPLKPFYVVNQGQPFPGFGFLSSSIPLYPQGGYARAKSYPRIFSYGYGMDLGYRAWRVHPHRADHRD
jgi:hypothetical protein